MVSSVSSLYDTTLHNGGVANTATTSSDNAFAATMATVTAEEEAAKKARQASAQTSATAAATSTAGGSATAGASSPQSTSWLLPKDAPPSKDKPNLAEFIDATGTDFTTASSLLYGTMGSNEDRRDWGAIMASGDPVAAARAGTGQMYGRPVDAAPLTALSNSSQTVIASSGNYVALENPRSGSQTTETELGLVDSQGNLLRKIDWSAPLILSSSRDFGLDTSALNGLADQLDAKGVGYKPYELYPNSDAGVDLRNLAAGGMGSAYDWRVDPNAEAKGESAVRSVANNLLLAQELGITGDPVPVIYNGRYGAVGQRASSDGDMGTGAAAASPVPTTTVDAELNRAIQNYAAQHGSSLLNTALQDAWSKLTH